MNKLIAHLRENVILDFQGDLNVEMVREFLKGDDTRDSRTLMAKLVADGGTDDMMLVLADCMLEAVQAALSDDAFREHLRNYAES
jgi:hypothetical protein